jgi:ribosomal protein L12E/L44/L45/RPP1/RPP2
MDKILLVYFIIIPVGDKIAKLVSAAGVKIEAYWPKLFAKAVEGQDITSFFNFGGPSGPATTSAPSQPAVKEAPK